MGEITVLLYIIIAVILGIAGNTVPKREGIGAENTQFVCYALAVIVFLYAILGRT